MIRELCEVTISISQSDYKEKNILQLPKKYLDHAYITTRNLSKINVTKNEIEISKELWRVNKHYVPKTSNKNNQEMDYNIIIILENAICICFL